MAQSPPPGRSRAEILTAAAVSLLLLSFQAWVLWMQISPQERLWIRLYGAGRLRSLSAAAAWQQGHRGMAAELATGRRSPRYLAAWGLSTVRDRAAAALEAMRP